MPKHIVNLNGKLHMVEMTPLEKMPPGAPNCNGNACGDLDIQYPGNGIVFQNTGGRRIRVTVRFAFMYSCGASTDIDLNPGQSQNFA